MRRLLLLLSLLLTTNAYALVQINESIKTHVFSQCETKEKIDTLNKSPVLLKIPRLLQSNVPNYPRRATRLFMEGGVLVEFDVDERGKVINPKVIWSENKIFNLTALKNASSSVYKPVLENGKTILYKGHKQETFFSMVDEQDMLNLGKKFDNLVLEIQYGLKEGKSAKYFIRRVEKTVKKIDSLLAREDLDKLTRAGLLYLKATCLYKIKAPNEEIKNLLIESKQHYVEEIVQSERGEYFVSSVTSMKLKTFGGILLGQMYLDESNWEKAEKELSGAILASIRMSGTDLPIGLKRQKIYQAYLQLGIASYYQQKWCLASKSWEKAKLLANGYPMTFPEQLTEPLEYSQSKNWWE